MARTSGSALPRLLGSVDVGSKVLCTPLHPPPLQEASLEEELETRRRRQGREYNPTG